jgi:amidophosphoribosyltransferase
LPWSHPSCGVTRPSGSGPPAEPSSYLGLFAQQHRGQEGAGIATGQNGRIRHHKAMGLVGDVFTPERIRELESTLAIGHVRYSTTGSSEVSNTQPLVVETPRTMIALGHNGNLVNSAALRRKMESRTDYCPIFHTSTDSEIILHLVARSPDFISSVKDALREIKGAYSLLLLTPNQLIAARDPNGFRPLCLGRNGDAWAVASESCAFDLTGLTYERDIEPGEIFIIDQTGTRSLRAYPKKQCKPSHCAFEHVYFARPDSRVFGQSVHDARRRMGAALADEFPVEADVVTPVPDSGMAAALGFADRSGIPFDMCFIRNHYVGRTFIQPAQSERISNVQIKLAIVKAAGKGKRVLVVDDSIIRGNTSRSRIKLLREAGAREVHLRISCPPTRWPCYYGIDFPTRDELIAARHSVDEIWKALNVDSLGYLSLEGMLGALDEKPKNYCTSCWTGEYPVHPEDAMTGKNRLASGKVSRSGT